MTANGYIAKENDDTPWSQVVWDDYYEFVRERGNIIVGGRTYELMKGANEFEKLGFPITVVISNSVQETDDRTFFVSSPNKALELIREKGFAEAVVGAAVLSTRCF